MTAPAYAIMERQGRDVVWHRTRYRECDGDWAPIACSPTEGIVFPGSPVRREPTCPDCIKANR